MKIETTRRGSRQMHWLAAALCGLSILPITGCLSMPEGSAAMKKQALSFSPPTGQAGVYVIRPLQFVGGGWNAHVSYEISLDYKEFGSLVPSYYLFGTLPPGEHTLRGIDAYANSEVVHFTAEAGKNYYFTATKAPVALVSGEGAPILITTISETNGQSYVRQLKLSGDNRFEFENQPGQTNQ